MTTVNEILATNQSSPETNSTVSPLVNATDSENNSNVTYTVATTAPPSIIPPQDWFCDDLGYNTCIRLMHEPKRNIFAGQDCRRQDGELLRIYDERYLQFILDEREKIAAGDPEKTALLSEMWLYYNDMNEELERENNPDVKNMDGWTKPLKKETLQKMAAVLALDAKTRSARSTGFFSSLNYDERFEEWDDLEGNWAENQPDNDGGGQHCVYLDADGKYDDFWCGTKELVYFCQKRPAQFSHIYHQVFPDAFKVNVLNQYCTKESCKFFAKGNETSQSRSGAFSDAKSWLNFDPLFAIESRPYYFKLNWGSGAFITWSQLQNPLEVKDDAEITPSDLTFYPADGIKEFGNGFRACDGLFFSGLRRSSNEHVFLDGSFGGDSFYQVGIAPEAFLYDFGFQHVLSFPMHEPRFIINPEVDTWHEECWDRSKIRENLRNIDIKTRELMFDFRKTRTNAAPRQGYRSNSNPVKSVDLFVSDQPFPSHGSLECNSQFTMKEHSVAIEGGYQCLKLREYTTPVFTGTPPEVTTEALADAVADVVAKKASTASAGGGIAGAAVGTLGLQFLPKLWDPAKKKLKEVKDWKRVHRILN